MRRFDLARLSCAALGLAACGKIRAIPGVEPKSRPLVSTEPQLTLGPWLMEPGATQMTVAWVTAAPAAGRVWYGTPEPDRLAQEGTPSLDHRVVLGSLQPGTRYRYRVEGRAPALGTFTTAPGPGKPFDVLVYGDNRSNSGDHALVVRAAAAEGTQLALHTGDMVVSAADEASWKTWFDEEKDLLSTTPFAATMGNHEITDNGVAYSRWFQRRGLPAYRSLDYGPLHVVVLDSFEIAAGATPRAGGISEAQRAWLEEDLRSVPKDRHVWVLVHQGPAAHPLHPRVGHGGSERVRLALLAAAKVHPIDAVLAGHEHFYERGEVDGLRYFVFGGGGAPLEDPDPSAPGVQSAQKALSYAVVSVCGCHAAGKVKDISGRVIDSFQLSTCEEPCGAIPAARRDELARDAAAATPTAAQAEGTREPSRRRTRTSRRSAAAEAAKGETAASDGGGSASSDQPRRDKKRRRRRSRSDDGASAPGRGGNRP